MNIRLLNSNIIRKRLFVGLVFSVVIFVVYLSVSQSGTVCYFDQEWRDGKTLPNVVENLRLRSHDSPKNIFFHETSCSTSGIIKLNSRQACAIESSGEFAGIYCSRSLKTTAYPLQPSSILDMKSSCCSRLKLDSGISHSCPSLTPSSPIQTFISTT